ncbi:MAG: hypothetical protein M1820_002155 [Bogoriella megaspora]|nr:MAG: hypothetical protein M1820_002155 [Bogoriella megaspora]
MGVMLDPKVVVIGMVTWSAMYLFLVALYRLFIHPLAKFPGPKLAALTTWYEGYYDVIRRGRYIFQIGKLHDKYGPIVRIGPNEVHILDHSYYDTLYSMTNRFDKYSWFYSMMGNPQATFATVDADLHRARRAALNPFFSAQAIARLRPIVQGLVDRFTDRMGNCAMRNELVPIFYAYRALTIDIISEYAFGSTLEMLDRADWGSSFYSAWRSLWEMSPWTRQWPSLFSFMMQLPSWAQEILNPKAAEVGKMFRDVDRHTKALLHSDPEVLKGQGHPTIVWEIAHSDALPPQEKTWKRISVEANSILAAGFETTGSMLAVATFHILRNHDIHQRLQQELEYAIPDPAKIPAHVVLEKLPYLTAIIKETLRIAVGAYSRLSRVNPHESIIYREWIIPPGTAVGMSALFIEHNPIIFPNPDSFIPDRWLRDDARALERYLVTFGRGTRSCVGINLAYAELYHVLAAVVRRFPKLGLNCATEYDMEIVADYFAGMTRDEGGRGLEVRFG